MHFLGEVQRKVRKRGKDGRQRDKEVDITRKETVKVLGIIQNGKISDIDDIPNEAWKYWGEKLKERV